MELTKTVKDKTFDNYFTEVDHCESISEDRPGSMRLFYLNVRSGRIKISDLEKFTMLNIGRYVFSRAKQEQYEKAGNLDAVMQQALRIMRKRGAADTKDTGNELGEIMIYAFLEEKLKAHKLLSKIELSTDAAQYESEADGIHFLCSDGASGSYNQMVFGASNIVGDVKDAINQAFEIINTSVDQTKRLIMAIKNDGLCYPKVKDGYFRHDVVLEFLKKLSNVFQWKIYESSTLGKDSLLSWYAVILCEWMEGNGLNYIMRAALKHHRDKPDDFWINRYTKGVYDDTSLIHRNIVFADTLEVIENIVLFSISNYFLRFSNEFRRIKGDDELDANNWYEYVEYGTTNPLTILLQRNGFSRESARFIKENPEYVVKDGSTGKLKLKASLSKCGRTSVENEVEYIRQNVPGIFVDEEG